MNRVAKRAKYLSIIMAVFIFCSAVFINDYRTAAHIWVTHPSNKNIYSNGELVVAGNVYSSDNELLLQSNSDGLTYAESAILRLSTLHVIGDKDNNIPSGVLASKRDKLIGYSLLNGVFGAMTSDNKISLTINAELSALAYEALGNQNGAVGIYNYETGEVLCMVSKPSYDPYYVPDLSQPAYEGVYINRVMNGLYVPGSIMKLVTAYAAVETIDNIYNQSFHCEHGIEVNGEWINCNGYHGTQNFEQALANSCNAAFADISLQLGNETLESYAKKAGVLSSYNVDGVPTSAGVFDLSKAGQVNLAWAGIGQYTTMVNPMQFMMFCGAIANGGEMVTPYYIESSSLFNIIKSDSTKLMSSQTASELKDLMRNNTALTYGEANFPGLQVGAKTGTAEVGDGSPHSWFVGFANTSDLPLAFVVIVENGTGTGISALNVTKTLLNRASNIYNP